MINHARTLLHNTVGPAVFNNRYYAEEYIPADFVPVSLPSTLQAVRNLLFGTAPDRDMLNYRTRQYMNMLHTTELEQFVLELDNRVTYDFTDSDLFPRTLFQPVISSFDSTDGPLTLIGEPDPPDQSGRMHRKWSVSVTSADLVKITLLHPRIVEDSAYTTDSGVSSIVPLPGSTLSVRFTPTTGYLWHVELYSRPVIDLGSVAVGLRSIGDEGLSDLFNRGKPSGSAEPFKTFYNMWKGHNELAFQLGGAILALIYRMDELR